MPALAPSLEFLTAKDWDLLALHAQTVDYQAGERVIRQGAPLHRLYVVRRGSVAIEINGREVARLGEGAVCGEMAFLEGAGASASVVAIRAVTTEEISAPELRQLFEMFPSLGLRFYKSLAVTLSRKLRDTSSKLAKLSQAYGG